MVRRLDSFSTEKLIALYKALGNDVNSHHRRLLRARIRTLLQHRKVTMDKLFGPEPESQARSAEYCAYLAEAKVIATACDN